jgi:hypothetical protein
MCTKCDVSTTHVKDVMDRANAAYNVWVASHGGQLRNAREMFYWGYMCGTEDMIDIHKREAEIEERASTPRDPFSGRIGLVHGE